MPCPYLARKRDGATPSLSTISGRLTQEDETVDRLLFKGKRDQSRRVAVTNLSQSLLAQQKLVRRTLITRTEADEAQ